MKSHPLFSLLISLLFTTGTLSATTPPPNDNLANAILLSGDSFTHTTEVHCATVEPDELPYRRFPVPFNDALLASLEQRTVWWKWVAPNSPASTGLQVNLTSSAPPSNSYIPHIEVMAFNGPTLEGIQVIYIGIDQPFIALPGRTYYFRGFYSPQPDVRFRSTLFQCRSGLSSGIIDGLYLPQLPHVHSYQYGSQQ